MQDRGAFLPDPTLTPDQADALAQRLPSSNASAANILMDGGTTGNLTDLVGRAAGRMWDATAAERGYGPAPREISAADANARFGIEGALHFDKPIDEADAANRQAQKRDELFRQTTLAHSTLGVLPQFGLSLAGGVVADPLGFALNFVPVAGEARVAGLVGESALATSRVAAFGKALAPGALQGLQGAAIGEGLTYGLAHGLEGRDYTLGDAAMGLTVGTLLGAGAHATLGAVGWRPPPVRTTPSTVVDDTFDRIVSLGERSKQHQVSPKGAFGVAQLMPDTARAASERLGIPYDEKRARTDETYNRQLGREEVRHLGQQFDDDPLLVAAGYNAGPGRVREWIKRFGDPRTGEISHADFAAKIPIRETRDYVTRVALNPDGSDLAAPSPASTPGGFDPVPVEISALDDASRQGALVKAIDDLANDRPVDVGGLIDADRQAGGGPRPELDDANAAPPIAARLGEADTAVTVRGSEVPVRYGVVELRDLVTSHDDDLVRNPSYPEALQPRDRERAGSQARLLRMEREFNPKLLMADASAAGGAPIVSPDGVVESGNGRTIVLRRSAEAAGELYDRYRGELERQGFDTAGMSQPVLVRIREQPATGAERVRLTREMNADVTERLSDTEQAFEDAAALSPADMALHQGGEPGAAANRAFVRRFVDQAAAGQENTVVDPETLGLTQGGERRVKAAMLARAYGDRDLVYAVHETTDERIRGLAEALGQAAPEWAAMRAAAARGELAEGVDITGELTVAVNLVRHARENRLDLSELLETRRGAGLFNDGGLSPETEALIRLFYRDAGLKQARSAEIVGDALADYARRAEATTPGATLFGDRDADAAEILASVTRKWTSDPDGAVARRAASERPAAPEPAFADVLRRGGPGDQRSGQGGGAAGERGAGGQGGGVQAGGDGADRQGVQTEVAARFAAAGLPQDQSAAAATLLAANMRMLGEAFGTDAEAEFARAGGLGVRSGEAPEALGDGQLGQPAYHGSPHVFDRFDTSKIGSGEGHQAYGHGLYFAGRREIAEYYREQLSKRAVTFDGQPVQRADLQRRLLTEAGIPPGAVNYEDGSPNWWVRHLTGAILSQELIPTGRLSAEDLANALFDQKAVRRHFGAAEWKTKLQQAEAHVALINRMTTGGEGRLYHVDIPEHDEFLDWDAAIGDQPKAIKAALKAIGLGDYRIVERDPRLGTPGWAIQSPDGRVHANLMGMGDGWHVVDRGQIGREAYDTPELAMEAFAKTEADRGWRHTGRELYQSLVDKLSPRRSEGAVAASKALHDAGIAGIRYLDASSRGVEAGVHHNYVVFDDSRVSITAFEQAGRGMIDFNEPQALITLFKSADASTAPHELGHFFLEGLQRNAAREGAPGWMAHDLATVREWTGLAPDTPFGREAHEQFARGFEAYLREGQAPTAGLAGVFARFRDWLRSLYTSAQDLGVELSDEMRGVFDRLLGGDQEPAAGKAAAEPAKVSTPAELALKAAQADPELRELAASTAQLEAELGDAAAVPARADPVTIADVVQAAASCLAEHA